MDPPAQKRVSKACEACKRRKVKCNGQERCQQCAHLGLRCIYLASAKPRSQGKRGHVISAFRSMTASASSISPPLLPATAQPGGAMVQPAQQSSCSPTSPSSPYPSRYDKAFFLDLIPDYLQSVYPVQPVITEPELRQYISAMDTDQEARSFLYSFGACTLNLTRYGDRRTDEVVRTIELLMDCAIDSMRPPYKLYRTSVMRCMQSMFIHNCLMSLQGSDAAFFYMRDAISHIQLLRIDNADNAANMSPPERSRRQRMYWQAYIHERFLAILDFRHAILPPLYTLPEDDSTIPPQVHHGFTEIIKLFQLLDPEFLSSWLGTKSQTGSSSAPSVTSTWVEAKSKQLEGSSSDVLPDSLTQLSTMQRADLAITREWLRTLVWRLAMSQTLLSSRSSKECLSLLFPVRLSQSLRHQVSAMSRHDIEVHGSSITQKLFEITDTIADVLIHVPAATLEETAHRIDDFLFILGFILTFPHLDATRRDILLEKLARLQGMFPEAVSANANANGVDDDDSCSTTATFPDSLMGVQDSTSPVGKDPWYQMTRSKTAVWIADDYYDSSDGAWLTAGPMGSGLTQNGRGNANGDVSTNEDRDVQGLGQELRQDPSQGQRIMGNYTGQLVTWNNISRRLSAATFEDFM